MGNQQQQVFIGVASIPSRIDSLRRVVESLLPQCGQLGVYLNGYSSVPSFLDNPKIVVQRSQVTGDLRDNGKFYFLTESKLKFYATVDDDILYPNDYVARLLLYLRISGGACAVGVHGFVLPETVTSISENRYVYHFAGPEPFLTPASVLGTGTTLFDQAKWGLNFNEFRDPGMADVWFAKAAKSRGASMWVIPRAKSWLTPIEQPSRTQHTSQSHTSLYDEFRLNDAQQVKVIQESGLEGSWPWFFQQLMSLEINRDNFCLTQAMQVCNMTERLGWTLPKDQELRTVALQVQSAKRRLHKVTMSRAVKSKFSSRWLEVYSQLAVDFSSGLVSNPNSLEFIKQLPVRAEGITAELIPNCLRWDARVDRQLQLKDFVVSHFLSSALQRDAVTHLPFESGIYSESNYEYLISLAGASVRCDFFRHPDLAQLVLSKPQDALDYCFRYLDSLPDLVDADLPSLEWWSNFFDSPGQRQQALILYSYLCSKSGNLTLADQIARDVLGEFGLSLEVFFLTTRLNQLSNRDSTPLQQRLNQLETQFAFHQSPVKTKKTPKISVVLTVFNQADEILGTLENILSSTYKNIEVLLVDDGSSDHTAEILAAFRHPSVRVLRAPANRGPYVSRNLAIQAAKGEFISFHDCGDYSSPLRLEAQVHFLIQNAQAQAVHTNHLRLDESGTLGLENNMRFVGDAPVTMMVRKSVFRRIGYFLPTRSRGDIEFLRRLKAIYGADSLRAIKFPFYIAGAAKNSIRFAPSTVRRFMSKASGWHKQLAENESIIETWVIDRLAPFEIPQELSADSPQVRLGL